MFLMVWWVEEEDGKHPMRVNQICILSALLVIKIQGNLCDMQASCPLIGYARDR